MAVIILLIVFLLFLFMRAYVENFVNDIFFRIRFIVFLLFLFIRTYVVNFMNDIFCSMDVKSSMATMAMAMPAILFGHRTGHF